MALEERDFDVIVVGAGCAGAVAAYVAAKQGKSVLMIDRGDRKMPRIFLRKSEENP